MQVPTFSVSTAQRTAKVAAAGFGVVAVFQLLLALGAPWGKTAFGGYNEGTLPPELRVVSSVSMAILIGAAFVVLGRAGHWGHRFSGVFRVGTWALVVILALGVLMNLASSSAWERFGWAPFTLFLAMATFVIARGRINEHAEVGVGQSGAVQRTDLSLVFEGDALPRGPSSLGKGNSGRREAKR